MTEIENVRGFTLMSIFGEVDLANVENLKSSLLAVASAPVLILSFERTEFIDSSVLGALVNEYKRRLGRLVVIASPTAPAYRILSVTGLVNYLFVVGSRSEAVDRAVSLQNSLEHIPADDH